MLFSFFLILSHEIRVFILVSLGYLNRMHTGWLKEQTFIFLHFWRLEVRDLDASMVGFSRQLSSQLADCCLLPVCPYILSLVHAC